MKLATTGARRVERELAGIRERGTVGQLSTVYFDTNAFGDLWTSKLHSADELKRLRRRLCSPLWQRRPVVIIGPKLISELAQFHDVSRRREQVEFLRALPDAKYVKSAGDRIRSEIKWAIGGEPADVFLDDEERAAMLDVVLPGASVWPAEEAHLAREKRRFENAEKRARAGMLSHVGSQKEAAAHVTRWFSKSEDVVSEWATDMLRRERRELGLPRNEATWPHPKTLPTVWAYTGFRAARIFLLHRDGRRIDPNDSPDSGHYCAAAYADCIISSDAKFGAIVKECPPPKPTLRTFAEWATDSLR